MASCAPAPGHLHLRHLVDPRCLEIEVKTIMLVGRVGDGVRDQVHAAVHPVRIGVGALMQPRTRITSFGSLAYWSSDGGGKNILDGSLFDFASQLGPEIRQHCSKIDAKMHSILESIMGPIFG